MSGTLALPVTDADHAKGTADAAVTLVEYGDYQCPACGMAYPFVQDILQRSGSKLRFVFRNFPLSQAHPYASMAAQVAEAAATFGRFWQMHDWLYQHQQAWTQIGAEGIADGAQAIGLDPTQLEQALEDSHIAERVRHDFMGGVRSGVNGTPSFYLNGQMYSGGFDTLGQAVDTLIAQAG
jgi:protein-disulfide isomerase